MKKARILLAALVLAAAAAPALAQTVPPPAMRAAEPENDGTPVRPARDSNSFFPDYSVAHRSPTPLQAQPAQLQPQQQRVQVQAPQQSVTNSWSPPPVTQVRQPQPAVSQPDTSA